MLRAHLFELFADCSLGSGGVGVQCVALYMNHIPWSLSHTTPAPYSKVHFKWARRTFYFIKDAICKITYLRRIPPWFALYRMRSIPNASKLRWNSILSLFYICGAERLVLIVANTTDSFEVEIRLSYYMLDRKKLSNTTLNAMILMLCVALVPLL